MPAAKSKDELLSAFDTTLAKLEEDLAKIDASLANQSLEQDDPWTIKAIIYHRTHWIGLFFDWIEGGENTTTPAPGYKWNALKAYNATLLEPASQLSWDMVKQDFLKAAGDLRAWIAAQDGDWLYTNGHFPWMNNWTLGRWAEAASAAHFRSARKGIRAILRAQQS